jgi:hypothetical protein
MNHSASDGFMKTNWHGQCGGRPMKLSDNYTKQDIETLNVLGFITVLLMFGMALIAMGMGII